jgi:DNA-binding NarL/FixJ family response regulator
VVCRKNILIADDNPIVRLLVRGMIESAGFDVCAEVDNGTDAIAKADQFHPDLILLDVYMPKLNGAEAASVLKKRNPDTPIVLFTIYEDSITTSLAKRIGADKVVGKASGLSSLVDALRELLEFPPIAP